MNVKIDVNINLSNVEAIINKIVKSMDLSRALSLDNKSRSIEVISDEKYIKEEAKEVEDITVDKLRYLLTDLSKNGKSTEAKEVLSKYNCTKVLQLKEEDYKKVYLELSDMNHKI